MMMLPRTSGWINRPQRMRHGNRFSVGDETMFSGPMAPNCRVPRRSFRWPVRTGKGQVGRPHPGHAPRAGELKRGELGLNLSAALSKPA